jgi:hypothetical protein
LDADTIAAQSRQKTAGEIIMSDQPARSANDAEWICVNEAVRGLEDRYRSGGEPDIGQMLPGAESPFRRRTLMELIKIDQEHRYQAGNDRPLETYLADWPELAADEELLVELLETECMTRMSIGQVPTSAELVGRFPEIAGRIDLERLAEHTEQEGGPTSSRAGENGIPDAALQTPPERYQIRAVLGRGAMGTVYRAYDRQLHREVALKIPSTDLGKDPRVWQRLFSEARAVASIQHRNVCAVYDVGQMHGGYYIAMALIEGESLASRLARGRLDDRQAATLAAKLAGALAAVHTTGIVHRDVKPQNVMLDAEGEPLLTDFGLARPAPLEGDMGGAAAHSGTPAYMSPEQSRGEPVTAASDIYSLGVVLYQMLSGRLPFVGRLPDLQSITASSRHIRLRAVRPGLDSPLESICLKAMQKRPEDRFRSARELENSLTAYLRSTEQVGRYSRIRSGAIELVSYLYLPPLSVARRIRLFAGRVTVLAVALAVLVVVPYLVFQAVTGKGSPVLEMTVEVNGPEYASTGTGDGTSIPPGDTRSLHNAGIWLDIKNRSTQTIHVQLALPQGDPPKGR